MDDALQKPREQLAMYRTLARKERDETGGETYGTCAYLEGAIVASQRALETLEGMEPQL